MSANDKQVAGSHYAASYQHWDFVADHLQNRYFEGQISRYLSRWKKKDGVQDLEKAVHYTDKLIELCESKRVNPPLPDPGYYFEGALREFSHTYELGRRGEEIMNRLFYWRSVADLETVKRLLTEILEAVHLSKELTPEERSDEPA